MDNDIQDLLENNRRWAAAVKAREPGFFTRLGDLLEPGPTYTNINDFRAIVVDRP